MSRKEFWSWVKTLVLAVLVALLIREKAMAFYFVDGSSMLPTLKNGELVAVNKMVYSLREPQIGEVVVFNNPAGNPLNPVFIKRIIALPGDSVAIVDGQVLVNGKPLAEEYVDVLTPGTMAEVFVEPGYVFLMGDNRYPGGSWDSRSFGPVLLKEVIGRAEIVLFPLPHKLSK